jgi:hypothetical protein
VSREDLVRSQLTFDVIVSGQSATYPSQTLTGSTSTKLGPLNNWPSIFRTARVSFEKIQDINSKKKPPANEKLSPKGPMTIPSFGGSSVAFLPLQNMTMDFQDVIDTASLANLSALLPPDIDPSIIAGYTAQIDQLLHLYASPHAAVEEVAWAGYASVCTVLIRPLSRGSIMINSTDPRKPPRYDFGTFSHPSDLEIAVRALKKVREWIASPAMQALGPVEILPGASSDDSNEAIAAAIKGFATSSWQHPTSSCSMLKREWGGVVDSQLRVYGVRGLRVVDASIFPMAVGGHTSSTVYAVAEKVSEIPLFPHHSMVDHS